MSPTGGRWRTFATTAMLLAGCRHLRPGPPRAAETLPDAVAARYLPPVRPQGVTTTLVERTPTYQVEAAALLLPDGDPVRFEFYRPDAPGPRPLVLVLPILGGDGAITRLIARACAEQGLSAIHVERPGDVFTPEQDGRALEELFRRAIVGTRLIVDWAIAEAGADPRRIGLVGISLGGILGTALLASEPRLDRAVLALAGADIPDIVLRSSEGQVRRYLAFRQVVGFDARGVFDDLSREFVSDPAHLARYVDPRGVLFIRARFDRVVPPANAERLWDLLGRPERIDVPTGHYTATLLLPYLRSRILSHFARWEPRS